MWCRGWGSEGKVPWGRLAWKSLVPGGRTPRRASQQPLPPAPPWSRPGCFHAKHPGASFAYPSAHFHIPQLWVAQPPQGWLTAATFVFTCHPGSCSFILRTGGGRGKKAEKKEKGENPSRQRDGHHLGSRKKMAPSGAGTQGEASNGAQGLGAGWSRRC